MYDVVVVGAGAAGLTAALCAAYKGKNALVLEAAKRPGRKLLATGNGRCNLWNIGEQTYFGNPLAEAVLEQAPLRAVEAFFARLGLQTCVEDGGRAYPASGQSSAVLDALLSALKRENVAIVCDAPVAAIEKRDGIFCVRARETVYRAKNVVVACGGMAGGKLGHDGGAYRLMTAFGHTLKTPLPALSPLVTDKASIAGLAGLRVPTYLTLCDGERAVDAAAGEMLFTEYGVSGVCVMQLAREAGDRLKRKHRLTLQADLSPLMALTDRLYRRLDVREIADHRPMIEECLQRRAHTLPKEALLRGLLPKQLAEKLERLSLPLPELAKLLSRYPLPVLAVRGMEAAQVTRGGIACGEFEGSTLESKMCEGLYACGEMLDVDGDCGGFNLLFAWASGMLCGQSIQ